MAEPLTGKATLQAIRPSRITLANGVRLVLLELPYVHRVAIVAELRVGSRYEAHDENGLSHLLEHMLYRGIPGHPTAHEQALAFEALGGTLVAGTGAESGSLSIACPKQMFEATLDLFARVYKEPLLGGLDIEKGIIREEILEHLDEDGTLIDDYDLLRGTAFEGHSLGYPVTGTVASVDGFDLARVRRHHAERYVGAASVIAVAGPVDVDAAARALERHFGDLPRGELPRTSPPPLQTRMQAKFVDSSSSQTAIRIGFRGEGVHDPGEPATEAVLRILDDGNSTRLYTRLCDERGLAYDVAAGYEAAEDAGLLDIGSDTAHAQAATVLSEILDVVRGLRDEGPSDAELEKAKARHRWGLEQMLDDPGEAADFLADGALRDYAETPAERAERLDAVSVAEVRRAAERLFLPERLSAVIVGPQPKRARARLTEILRGFR